MNTLSDVSIFQNKHVCVNINRHINLAKEAYTWLSQLFNTASGTFQHVLWFLGKVAVCCSVLEVVAVCVLLCISQCVAASVLWEGRESSLFKSSCIAKYASIKLKHAATRCNTLQYAAIYCNTLQHTSTHCNTLQHTATRTHHQTARAMCQRDKCM